MRFVRVSKRKSLRAVLGCSVAATLLIASGIGIDTAFAADDDDVPGVELFRNFLFGLGLKRGDDGSGLEYHERSPLVVPPTRDLPPPETASAATKDPAWPKDPDIERRAATKKAARQTSVLSLEDDTRQLRPNELRNIGTPSRSSLPRQTEAGANPSPASELSSKGWSFGSIFGSKEEVVQFGSEPPRTSLVEPPPGLRTPSPNYAYGTKGAMEPVKGGEDVQVEKSTK